MARKSGRSKPVEEDIELDEVDAFNANRDNILLEEAGDYYPRNDSDDQEPSDEEVLALKEDKSDDDLEQEEDIDSADEIEGDEGEDAEGDEEGWGRKQNYYGGDDASDDEQGKQMAEEAIRQQKKHLQELELDDYIDEDMMEDWKKSAEQFDNTKDSTAQLVIDEDTSKSLQSLDKDEQLRLLKTSFPEFIPLTKEFNLNNTKLATYKNSKSKNELIETKIVALSAYLSSIASYFALFADNLKTGENFLSMKENPVMESVLSARELWRQANELPETETSIVSKDDAKNDDQNIVTEEIENSSEDSEEDEELASMEDDSDAEITSGSEEHEEELDIDINSKRNIKRVSKSDFTDFTESATPENVDMEEKQRRKKSLRFYTSKIDQASQKNNADRYGGDMDLPYRERLFERQQRLIEEARKRGLGEGAGNQLGDDLDGAELGSEDEREAQEINENNDNDDYYQSIKQAKQDKKEARREAHELATKAAKEGKLAELQDVLGEAGKRALNFQILKNKGLTPHRKNIDRNARVKKRKKYDKAQKKLKSIRQVYDDSNRGQYEGEKTGIKKGVSRSTRFN